MSVFDQFFHHMNDIIHMIGNSWINVCTAYMQRIETLSTDHKLVVAFDNAGEKTLLAKFAKLTKL